MYVSKDLSYLLTLLVSGGQLVDLPASANQYSAADADKINDTHWLLYFFAFKFLWEDFIVIKFNTVFHDRFLLPDLSTTINKILLDSYWYFVNSSHMESSLSLNFH